MTTEREYEFEARCHEEGVPAALADVVANTPSHARNSVSEEYAALNLVDGKAAFASEASFSNAFAGQLHQAANRLASLEAAQDEYRPRFARMDHDVYAVEWLDTLIPLNGEALAELWAAYGRAKTFRTRGELIRRRSVWPAFSTSIDKHEYRVTAE